MHTKVATNEFQKGVPELFQQFMNYCTNKLKYIFIWFISETHVSIKVSIVVLCFGVMSTYL